jgi:hypothetical protein
VILRLMMRLRLRLRLGGWCDDYVDVGGVDCVLCRLEQSVIVLGHEREVRGKPRESMKLRVGIRVINFLERQSCFANCQRQEHHFGIYACLDHQKRTPSHLGLCVPDIGIATWRLTAKAGSRTRAQTHGRHSLIDITLPSCSPERCRCRCIHDNPMPTGPRLAGHNMASRRPLPQAAGTPNTPSHIAPRNIDLSSWYLPSSS